jgi:hypothetical protein
MKHISDSKRAKLIEINVNMMKIASPSYVEYIENREYIFPFLFDFISNRDELKKLKDVILSKKIKLNRGDLLHINGIPDTHYQKVLIYDGKNIVSLFYYTSYIDELPDDYDYDYNYIYIDGDDNLEEYRNW